MTQAHLASTLFVRASETRSDPQVKSAKTCEKSLCGVSRNSETAKTVDPTCYNACVDQTNRRFDVQIKTKRVEYPWAVAKKPGYAGTASGLYFHFYRTEAEAEKCRRYLARNGKYQEPVKFMPGECFSLGEVVF